LYIHAARPHYLFHLAGRCDPHQDRGRPDSPVVGRDTLRWDAYRQFSGGVHQLVLNLKIRRQLEMRNVELDELNQKLRVIAIHDQLTGLYNRHFMVEQIERQRELFARHDNVCCIVLFDIDHFKQINDRYGHAVGDDVLVAFSRRVEVLLRQGDVLGRYGGEEFLLLLPMIDLNAALHLAERIRCALADSPVPLNSGKSP